MELCDKILLFEELNKVEILRTEGFYDTLEKCGALVQN